MDGIPQALLVLLNAVIAPLCVRILQAFKRATGLSGTPMLYISVGFSWIVGTGIAVVFGLVTWSQALSPYILLGSGGVTTAIAMVIYNALKGPLKLGGLPSSVKK